MERVLVLNAGSSSLKVSVFDVGAPGGPRRSCALGVNGIGGREVRLRAALGAAVHEDSSVDVRSHADALAAALAWIEARLPPGVWRAAGHRVAHGGDRFGSPVRVDDAVLHALRALTPLAPLHQPHNIAGIEAARAWRPGLAQVACFDTAFHRTIPAVARRYALPRALEAQGVRGYGFHGLSYEYIAGTLPARLGTRAMGRVVVAHLGSGASLCAMRELRSVATTMGFTPLDGVPMATRPGRLDPGVVLHLIQQLGMTPEAVTDMLYHRSGLLGVSGLSERMEVLLASEAPAAREAVELFVYRVALEIGALAAALGGLDALVFTGGIGENSPPVRARIARRLAFLGLSLDEAANAAGSVEVHARQSAVAALVIPTDEEAVIAAHATALARESSGVPRGSDSSRP